MHNGTRTGVNQHGGGHNVEEDYKKLDKNEYRLFEDWVREHGQELHDNKIAYEVRFGKDDYFYVKLCDNNLFDINEILLDIHQKKMV